MNIKWLGSIYGGCTVDLDLIKLILLFKILLDNRPICGILLSGRENNFKRWDRICNSIAR